MGVFKKKKKKIGVAQNVADQPYRMQEKEIYSLNFHMQTILDQFKWCWSEV